MLLKALCSQGACVTSCTDPFLCVIKTFFIPLKIRCLWEGASLVEEVVAWLLVWFLKTETTFLWNQLEQGVLPASQKLPVNYLKRESWGGCCGDWPFHPLPTTSPSFTFLYSPYTLRGWDGRRIEDDTGLWHRSGEVGDRGGAPEGHGGSWSCGAAFSQREAAAFILSFTTGDDYWEDFS